MPFPGGFCQVGMPSEKESKIHQGRGGGPCSVLGASSMGSTPGCQAGSELLPPQNRERGGRRAASPVSPLSCLMPLQCFPPPCLAKKWPEAASFCTVGCWPAPWARCPSRQAEGSQPGTRVPVLGGCGGTHFGRLPAPPGQEGKRSAHVGGLCKLEGQQPASKTRGLCLLPGCGDCHCSEAGQGGVLTNIGII